MVDTLPVKNGRVLNAVSDSTDFRDIIYQPQLTQLAKEVIPDTSCIKIRDQGTEGACTGFGLGAVIDYLNHLRVKAGILDSFEKVSTRMLYEMARKHDRWPGEDYDGSSARGAMKGWSKNGVCTDKLWPYSVSDQGYLTQQKQVSALKYPLGAYNRVLKNRTAMQAALNEIPAIYVTANVHDGWFNPQGGRIEYHEEVDGGHAFAILGYTAEGFIVQNSWGKSWGGLDLGGVTQQGLAIWSYRDFEKNMRDAWVARMALPLESVEYIGGYDFSQGNSGSMRVEKAPPRDQIYKHYIHIDDGYFDPYGNYPTLEKDIDSIIAHALEGDHVMFYAHGGLNSVKSAAQRVAMWRNRLEENNIRELHFIWETGLLEEIRDVLLGKQKHAEDRVGGLSNWWDKLLEKLTHPLGRPIWKEMISDAVIAFKDEDKAGSSIVQKFIDAYNALPEPDRPTIQFVGHSAGSVWFSHMLQRWKQHSNAPVIDNLILFAPACTVDLFETHIKPVMQMNLIKKLSHFLLSDRRERDDHTGYVYRKSLLYLVSNSFQKPSRHLFKKGVPLMGMMKFEKELKQASAGIAIGTHVAGESALTESATHGGFDNDLATMNSMLRLVCGNNFVPFTNDDLND